MRKRKTKILRIISTLNPEYGGPSRAIIDSSIILNLNGIDVDILTCDNPKQSFFKSKKIKVINMGPSLLGTYWFSFKLFYWLIKNRKKYDSFIVHGIWQFKTLIASLLLKKNYYVFLHGQLDPFFKKNFIKTLKKKLYWILIEKKNLLNAKYLLLTSKGEKQTLKKTFVNTDKMKKKIIKYGIIKPVINKKELTKIFYKKFKNFKEKKFYLFLGRFHEKKGCEIIIESVNNLKNSFNDLVLMAGPLNNSLYEEKINSLIKKYNLENKIIISNGLFNNLKWAAIQECKAMLLPSHGENFGVSLVESLCFSRPVLTTNKVNIYKDILHYNAGLVSNNTVKSFTKILKKFDNYDNKILHKLSKNSFNCFDKNFNLRNKNNDLVNLLKK